MPEGEMIKKMNLYGHLARLIYTTAAGRQVTFEDLK
jgi:hypothetical protein